MIIHTHNSYHAYINIFALFIAMKEKLLIKLTNVRPRGYCLGRFPNETIFEPTVQYTLYLNKHIFL